MKRVLWLLVMGMMAVTLPSVAQQPLNVAQRVTLGGEGGWDYLTRP